MHLGTPLDEAAHVVKDAEEVVERQRLDSSGADEEVRTVFRTACEHRSPVLKASWEEQRTCGGRISPTCEGACREFLEGSLCPGLPRRSLGRDLLAILRAGR